MKRWIVAAAGLAVLVALFLVLRPGGTESDGTPRPTATEHPHEDGGGTVDPNAPASGEDVPVVLGVKAGEVTGPGTVTVRQGDRVHLSVTADVEDEVHVHGYDVMGDVGPETPAHVEFTASTPGVFEVELEDAGLLLVRIRVEP